MQHRQKSASRPGAPWSTRRGRAALSASTALQAAALAFSAPCHAQPAANARPAGGQVSAGSASIGGNATTTLIRQSSQNAVINWQSYDVGGAQTVQYAQPGAASFTLNRVVSASPSQIAGHILANGRIAIVNQSGVVFLQGSTVDTAGLVVSAAGITDQDFMAGRLVFVQPPQPGAAVSNAGHITVRQAGLAALVAPQVANSGVITASLGRVVLGGAATHTLDLYGDGLVALNVTGQVTQVQLGGRTVTALVTNTGTILAPGGTVVLTAQAADGVVSKLISADGTIAAPSVGGQAGRVLVSGVGGDIEIDGAVQATGAAGAGGSVTVTGSRDVMVASGSVLDASGATGGGAVSLLAPSGNAVVAAGAVVRARGTVHGPGGRITVRAGGTAGVHGTLDASGATSGDAGGTLAVSGGALSVDGLLTASLPGQPAGHAAFTDTGSLTVQSAKCANGANCLSFAAFLNDLSTIVDTDGAITFVAGGKPAQSKLTSTADISLTTTLSGTVAASGDIVFDPGLSLFAPNFVVNAAGNIDVFSLLSGTGGKPATSVTLTAGGDITEHNPAPNPATSGTIETQALIVSARNVVLDTATNVVATLGSVTAGGSFTLLDASGLSITAPLMAGGDVAISVTGSAHGVANGIALDGGVDAGTHGLALIAAGDITGSGAVNAGTLAASAGGAVTLDAAGSSFGTIGAVGTLSGITAEGAIAIGSGAGTLEIADGVTGSSVMLKAGGLTLDSGVTIQATTGDIGLAATAGTLLLSGTVLTGTAPVTGIDAALTTLSATGGDLTEAAGASIQTGTLKAAASQAAGVGGAVALGSTANIVGTLAGGSAEGDFALGDSTALTIAASTTVSGTNITFDTGSLVLLGGAAADASADFTAMGGVAEGSGAVIKAGTLATIAGSLSQSMATLSAGTLALGAGGQAGTLSQVAGSILLGAGGGTIALTGGLTQDKNSTISAQGGTLSLGTGGSQILAGLVRDASGTVELLATGGGITQTGAGAAQPSGTLIAATLALQAGNAGGAAFDVRLDDGAVNSVGTLSAASVTGALILDQSTTLTLAGEALGSVGGTLTLGEGLAALAGATIDLGGLAVAGNLAENSGANLAATGLASIAGTLTQIGGTLSGGTVSIGTALATGNTAVALMQSAGGSLNSGGMLTVNGAIAQDASALSAAGSVTASSLTQTGSSVTLGTGSGGGLTVSGDLAQDSASSITGAGGTLALTSTAGNLFLAGLVSDVSGLVSLSTPAGSITQAASGAANATGVVVAGMLSAQAGTAGGAAFGLMLGGAASDANAIGTITTATATGAVDVADGALQPTLTIAAGGTIASGTGFGVTLDAGLLLLLGGASIASGADFSAGGAVTQDLGATIGALGSAATGGALTQTGATLTATGDVTIGTLAPGGTTATLLSQNATSLLHAGGALDVLGSATQTASTLSAGGAATIADSVTQNASSLSGTSVAIGSATLSGTLAQSGASTIAATGADVVAMLSGALTQDGSSAILARSGNVTLASTGGGLSLGGTVASLATGTLSLSAGGGDITESATGSLLGGTLVASAMGGIDLATVSGPGIGNDLPVLGRVAAGGAVALADGVFATLAGTLSGSGAALRTPTLTVLASGAIDISSGGTLSIGSDRIGLAGQVSAPNGLVAIGLLHPGTFSVVAGGTIDPGSLQQIRAGTIALGTTDGAMANGTGGANATWNATTTGSVSTLSVLSALDLSTATGTLGLFSNGAVLVNTGAPSNGVTVASLYGAAAGDFLAPSPQNAIEALGAGGLTAQGGTLVLATSGPLTVAAGVEASGTDGATLTALAGPLRLDAGGTIGSAAGDVSLSSSGALLLGGLVSGPAGQVSLAAGQTITQTLPGGAPSGTLLAGTLVAQAGTAGPAADLLLNSTTNTVGVVALATASGQAWLADMVGVLEAAAGTIAGAGVTLTLAGQAFTQGSGSAITSLGTVSIDAASLTQADLAAITAQAGFFLTGDLTQQSRGSIQATTLDLHVAGSATQSAGSTLSATSGSLLVDRVFAQTASQASAGLDVVIGQGASQSGGTILAGGMAAIGGGLAQSAGSSIAAGAVDIGTAGAAAGVSQADSSITGTSGSVVLTLSGGLAQDPGSAITSQLGSLVIHSTGGTLAAGGTLSALAGLVDLVAQAGDVTQIAAGGTGFSGVIDAASLGVQAGVPGVAGTGAVLLGGVNTVGTLVGAGGGTISGAAGQFTLADQASLTLAAGTTLSAGADLFLTLTGPATLTQGGSSAIAATGAIAVQAASLAQEAGASLTGGTGVTLTGDLQQTGQDTFTATQGSLTVTGAATQAASAIDAPQGDVSVGSLGQTASTLLAGGAVSIGPGPGGTSAVVLSQLAGSVVSAGGGATVYGAATQNGSALTASGTATVFGSLGQLDATLSGSAVTIGQNGLAGTLSQVASTILASGGQLAVALSGDLTQDAASTLASPAGGISLASTGGGLALGGFVSAPSGMVGLVAPLGDITQTAPGAASGTGTLQAVTLAAQAGGPGSVNTLSLDGGANQVGTVTQATATGTLLLVDAGLLSVAGSGLVSGTGGVTLRAPLIAQLGGGTIASSQGSVDVQTALLTQGPLATLTAATGFTLEFGSLSQDTGAIVSTVLGDVSVAGNLDQLAALVRAALGNVGIGGTLGQTGGTIAAGGALSVGGQATQAGGTITAGGAAGIGGNLAQAQSTLAAGGALTVGGTVTQGTSTIEAASLSVTGDLAQTNGLVIVTGDTTVGGVLAQSQSNFTSGGSLTAGIVSQQNYSLLTPAGALTAGAVTQQGGSTLAAGGALTVGGALQQSDSTASGASANLGSASQTASTLTTLGDLTVSGALAQNDSQLLVGGAVTVFGAVSQQNASLLTANGAFSDGGTLQQTGSQLSAASASVGGAVTQSASTLTSLGSVALLGSLDQTNAVFTAGADFSVAGYTTQNASNITAAGALSVGGALVQTASQASAASATVGGLATQSGSTLTATGAIGLADGLVQTSSDVLAGGILSVGGGAVSQSGGARAEGAGGVLFSLTGGLAQSSAGVIASGAGDVSIATSRGDLDFAGLIASSPGGQVALSARNGIIAGSEGAVQAGALSAQAFFVVDLSGAGNRIASIGPVSIAGGLSQSGVASDSSGVFVADGSALLLQNGAISGVSGVRLTLASDLTEAATGTLNSYVGPIDVISPGRLSFAGLMQAPQIVLGAFPAPGAAKPPAGSVEPAMIAWNGGTVVTGTALAIGPGEPYIPAPISPASSQGARGLFATAADFSQTGTTRVLGLGQRSETVEFSLTGPGGLIAFDPSASAGLFAPGAQLLLDLQTAGRATGNIDVAGLNIFTGEPATGGASLTGLVDGRGGSAAAASGFVHGLANVRYEDNGCPVQSLNCVLLSPVVVPLGSPVQNLEVAVTHDPDEDDDLILPNVAEQDY